MLGTRKPKDFEMEGRSMKRIIVVRLFVTSVLLAGVLGVLLRSEVVVQAAVGEDGPVGNGDVNADGTIDLSDAVYMLGWIFTGGSAPVAIECPSGAGKGLPATGQTKCYGELDGQWVEMPCDKSGCSGQDAYYRAGCSSDGRFVDNGDGTVTDNCTGLMWQKDTANIESVSPSITVAWCEALAYCEDLIFARHEDWRLPNVRELQSLVDYGRVEPAIDPVFGAASWYISSSSDVGNPLFPWMVNFDWGLVYSSSQLASWDTNVRAVRDARGRLKLGSQLDNGDVNGDGEIDISDAIYILTWLFSGGEAPFPIDCPPQAVQRLPATGETKCYSIVESVSIEVPCDQAECKGQDGQYMTGCASQGRFVDNGDGTVTDTCTGLMWQQAPADISWIIPNLGQAGAGCITLAWCEALSYCEGLTLAGHEDWRLPNVRELQSIIEYGRVPAIDPVVFEGSWSLHWSSSSNLTGRHPWIVHAVGVVTTYCPAEDIPVVRAVRNDR
jgi:hypothetical protein